MEERILEESRREEPEEKDGAVKRDLKPAEKQGTGAGQGEPEAFGKPQLWVFLEEERQLPAALADPGVAGIYLDAGGFAPDGWKKAVMRCRERGKACGLALPHIFRAQGEGF